MKCGKCVPSCTIYRIHKDETTSPRGFLDLIAQVKQESLEFSPDVKGIFDTCFLCTTCVQVCPLHLPIDVMIEKVRYLSTAKHPISWHKKLYFFLLRHPKLMDFVFSFCHVLAPCAFKQENDKLKWRFKWRAKNPSLNLLQKRAFFPFASKSFLNSHPAQIMPQNPAEQPTKKVGIFIGCLGNYNYPNVGKSLLSLLDKLGMGAILPKQVCCGAPAYFSGDAKSALFLAQKNTASLANIAPQVEAILVPEATCISMLKKDYPHVLKNIPDLEERQEWLDKFSTIQDKLQLASAFLAQHTALIDLLKQRPKSPLSLTYHDPCHAKKVLGVYAQPRMLLQANHQIIEMQESDRCCGFGGVSMQSEHYSLTLQAGLPKAYDIVSTHAQIVSAECSACRVQLNNALEQIDAPTQFLHPLELLDRVLA
ncbi:Anaerobic glycerol-3-phosphate dehydrogenase subunit C GlpC [Helicobacter bizzozeronii]|uniref:(Fe-S)-binding protein n=1 Tax=Helicobacter bizzozeronii TaxID=56877 RepID=UPI00244D875B|nr:(Fe-S)-binding protein [Helicobacter bizzozeronii]GMB93336.1 Anaerobic glycerol-3-phosphate dehydrogenase subunit C GlpC [Helicobacter bizzozeronii]